MIGYIIGLCIKFGLFLIFILGAFTTHKEYPESAAAFVLLALVLLFGVLEHLFNPYSELTGKLKIF